MNNVGTKRVKVRERSDDGVLQAVFHNWSRSGPVFYVCPMFLECFQLCVYLSFKRPTVQSGAFYGYVQTAY